MDSIIDLLRGWWRVFLVYLLAGIISFVAVFGLVQFVPSIFYAGLLIAVVVTYFSARKLVPFSRYSETKNYKYGRWMGVAMWFLLMGQNIVRHFSAFTPTTGSPVPTGVSASEAAIVIFFEVTILLALVVGYIGARNKKSSVSVSVQ